MTASEPDTFIWPLVKQLLHSRVRPGSETSGITLFAVPMPTLIRAPLLVDGPVVGGFGFGACGFLGGCPKSTLKVLAISDMAAEEPVTCVTSVLWSPFTEVIVKAARSSAAPHPSWLTMKMRSPSSKALVQEATACVNMLESVKVNDTPVSVQATFDITCSKFSTVTICFVFGATNVMLLSSMVPSERVAPKASSVCAVGFTDAEETACAAGLNPAAV